MEVIDGNDGVLAAGIAHHQLDWQPYPVDPYSTICDDHTYIHAYYVGC